AIRYGDQSRERIVRRAEGARSVDRNSSRSDSHRSDGIARKRRIAGNAVRSGRFAGAWTFAAANTLRSAGSRGGRFCNAGELDGRSSAGGSDVWYRTGSGDSRPLASVAQRALWPTGVEVGSRGNSAGQLTRVLTVAASQLIRVDRSRPG